MSSTEIERFLNSFAKLNVLVVGDVMLDRFIRGNVSRISPEAPVPVVAVHEDEYFPGGAANVARNLAPFARKVSVIGLVGDDTEGAKLSSILEDRGLDGSGMLVDPKRPTTLKTRVVARGQQVVRFDHEDVQPISEAQVARVVEFLREQIGGVDAIVLQDYGKGFVTQSLVDQVMRLASENNVIVAADPNPNNPLRWTGVTAVKPNRLEAFKAAGVVDRGISDPPETCATLGEVAEKLFGIWEAKSLLVTLGELGMVVFEKEGRRTHIPSRAREVFDVSGAGDTAIALFTMALAAEATFVQAAEISNYASAVVVAKSGTATLSPDDLIAAFREH
ncbi:MAG: PfkB family carbohydrate kinase [Verrucomicrobiota bacterium]